MEKVCHAVVDDMGSDSVFWGKKQERKNIENSEKICPHGTYTGQGPQGSINVCITLISLNIALNCKHLMYMCVYAFDRHEKGVC